MESPQFLDKNAVSFGNYSVSFAQNSRSNFSKAPLFSENAPSIFQNSRRFCLKIVDLSRGLASIMPLTFLVLIGGVVILGREAGILKCRK